LREPASLRGLLLVTFEPSPLRATRAKSKTSRPATKRQAARMGELEQELQFTRESLRSTVEELQSANEELQSTNEELQSSNEELETSREEMQSLNEELQTVNAQLQTKVDALSQTNDDMQNLLNSTSIATLFLDSHLKIKRFTEQAKAVINLIPSDVGRPIGDLVSNLNYDELERDATEVLRTLNSKEREVRTKTGGWRLVRILPYRTMENMIDGLVVTFIDINKLKMASEEAQAAKLFAESVTMTLREPILVMDLNRRILSVNESFQRFFRLRRSELEQRKLEEIAGGGWAVPKLRALLERVQAKNTLVKDFSFTHVFPKIGRRVLLVNARKLQRGRDMKGLILLAMEDITDRGPKGKPK
jgi:two-component system CheB/CheR fusion protein